jgi:hypothetical protein
MPQLSITNVGQAEVVIIDPQGITEFTTEVAPAATVTKEVSNDLLQRLTPDLKAMETPSLDAAGNIVTGIQWSVSHSTGDIRAASTSPQGLPQLNELQAQNYSTGSGATDVVATGTGLLGGQVKATLEMPNVAGDAQVDFEAVAPGGPGNNISVDIVTPTGSLTITVTVNKIEIQPASGGSTASAIAAAVNGDSDAKLLVQASEGVGGTINEAIAEQNLAGGEGPGVSLALDGTAMDLSEVTDTQLTFDLASGVSANLRVVPLQYRSGPHLAQLSVPVVT